MATQTPQIAREKWRRRRSRLFATIFAPRPRLTVSQWADRYRKLSSVSSGEPGQWSTDRTPYLREIMDAISDPEVHEIVLMKSARVGFTEGVLGNAIGFHVHQEPCPMLMVQPSIDDAKSWSKENLAPMLTETPVLSERISDGGSRDTENTLLSKSFAGGILRIVGAVSPRGFRRFTARKVYFDEVDGYPASAGNEGDPITLGKKRALTLWNRQFIYGSTPTLRGFSRIESLFNLSDQRHFHVPCPHCEHRQRLIWGGPDADSGIKYETWEAGGKKFVVPGSVAYLCVGCGTLIEERDKERMVVAGGWVAENPGSPVRGYHINALYSLFVAWEVLVQEWLDAQGSNELLQVFVNTVLGETWEDRTEKLSPESLQSRCEDYGEDVEVPAPVGVLTAAVDVQGDRLELAVKGWGEGQESWLITHQRIYGDPDLPDVWARLETLLTRGYQHESGAKVYVSSAAVDSNYNSEAVYGFVRGKEPRGVFAIRGNDTRARELLTRPQKKNKFKVKPVTIATYSFKDVIFARLKRQTPGPGYMHFCRPREAVEGIDANYFEQFAAEVPMAVRDSRNVVRKVYKQVKDRNEAIDLEVYALAALYAMGPAVYDHLEEYVARIRKEGAKVRAKAEKEKSDGEGEAEATSAKQSTRRQGRPRSKRRGGWASSW